jgi:hypothetical protein
MDTNSSKKSSKNPAWAIATLSLVGIGAIVGIVWWLTHEETEASLAAVSQKAAISQVQQVIDWVHDLEVESLRGTEYFNSAAYDSLIARSDTLTAKRLQARIKEPNRKYFLTLLALREMSRDVVYPRVDIGMKAAILTDQLKHATYFNAWGLPGFYSDSSYDKPAPVEAVIELGQAVVPNLRLLLSEKRSAPRWGSEERFQNETYKYRVADYAYALIQQIGPGQ